MTKTIFKAAPAADANAAPKQANPNKRNKILVVVDTQIDFVMRYGKLPVDEAEKIIIPGIGILANLDSSIYAAVLFTYDTHVAQDYLGSPENVGIPTQNIPGFPIHCEKGTPGWENVFNPLLVPKEIPIYQLEKDVFNMWEKDGDETLVYEIPRNLPGASFPQLGRNRESFFDHVLPASVDTAVVMGVASDFCVKDAIAGLLARGLKIEVIEQATAGIIRQIAQTVAEEFLGQVDIV